MGNSANEAVKSSLTTQMQSKITTNSNLNNNRNSYNVVDERNNGIHHRRNQLKSIYSNQLQGYYPTGDQHRRKIYHNEIIATNNEQIPFLNDKSYSEISAQKILNKLKRPFGQEDVDSILDQNIERIIEEIAHQRRNDVDIDKLSENYEDNAPKTLSFQNKQQKLFPKKVYPFNQIEKYHNNISARINSHEKTLSRNLFKKGKSIVEQKQPATLDIMSELEKIEDELANINNQERKDQEIFERKILTPQSTFGYKKYLKVENRGNKKNKQNMGSKSVPELQQRKRSNTSNSASKIGNKNVILKELNEIKDELGNISTISLKKKGKSQTPIMLDVGDKISNALEKDWDLDKRSRIPRPRGNWNALHYWRKSVRNPRSKAVLRTPYLGNENVINSSSNDHTLKMKQDAHAAKIIPQLELVAPAATSFNDQKLDDDKINISLGVSSVVSKLVPENIGSFLTTEPREANHSESHVFVYSSEKKVPRPLSLFLPYSRSKNHFRYRQPKAVIPSPSDSNQEHPSFQDIHEMFIYSKRKTQQKNVSENKDEATISHLLVHLNFENSYGLKIMDSSGMDHNAKMFGSVLIVPGKGQCKSFGTFQGGKIFFNAKDFLVKPSKAITVAVWVKLKDIFQSVSIFSVQRGLSGEGGKLDLRIFDGNARWTHVDENRKLIFNINTNVPSIANNKWNHIVGTYDSEIHLATVVLNGQLFKENEASGLLSQQWLGDIGIGLSESLYGDVDEFYLYDRALTTPEINTLRHKCPSLIALLEDEPSKISAIRTSENKTKILPFTNHTKDSSVCSQGTYHVNSTLRGGRDAGKFEHEKGVRDVVECFTRCCAIDSCDLAFMDTNGLCYRVKCKNDEGCKPTPATEGPSSVFFVLRKMVSFKGHHFEKIDRHSSPFLRKIDNLSPETGIRFSETSLLKPATGKCKGNGMLYNVDIKGGLSANSFQKYPNISSMEACLGFCCKLSDCDIAMIRNGDCFSIFCSTHEMCRIVDGGSLLSLVSRPPSRRLESNEMSKNKSTAKNTLLIYYGFNVVKGSSVVDGSGKNNNGTLENGAKIIRFSRHGPGLDLTTGDLVVNGLSFKVEPYEGLSIAAWIKLSNIDGDHVIFSSVDRQSRLSQSSCLLKVNNGRLFWSCLDKTRHAIFTVVSPLVIGPNTWNHVVVCYDTQLKKAKVLVNGRVKAVGRGKGEFSKKMDDVIYFGSTAYTNDLNGYLDEIYIFKRSLKNVEVRQYLINIDTRGYHLNNISRSHSARYEKDFPFSKAKYRLKSGSIITKIYDRPSVENISSLELPKTLNYLVYEKLKSATAKTASHNNQTNNLPREWKSAPSPSHEFSCAVNGNVYNKYTFRGGLKAGKFTKIADNSNMNDCIYHCCQKDYCDAAIMKGVTCFALKCQTRKLCEVRPANLLKFDLKIVFVKRTQKKNTSQSEKTLSSLGKCYPGIRISNVTINAGLGAGKIVQFKNVTEIDQCVLRCCSLPSCNTAFLVQKSCYAISCIIKNFCKLRAPPSNDFISEVAYVNRSGLILFRGPQDALMSPLTLVSSEKNSLHKLGEEKNTIVSVKPQIHGSNKTYKNTSNVASQLVPKTPAKHHRKRMHLNNLMYALKLLQRKKKIKELMTKLHHDLGTAAKHIIDEEKRKSQQGEKVHVANKLHLKHRLQYHHGIHRSNMKQHKTHNLKKHRNRINKKKIHMKVSDVTSVVKNISFHNASLEQKREHLYCHLKFGCQHGCHYLDTIGYQCLCPPDMVLAFDGKHCLKNKKCIFGWHHCQQECVQLNKGFKCECTSGFTLNKDDRHCDDIDECLLGISKCSQQCVNLPGSYVCTCRKGFALKLDNKTCENNVLQIKRKTSYLKRDILTAPVEVAVQFLKMKVYQGQRAILNCRARASPAPLIKWANGGDGALPLARDDRYKITRSNSLLIEHTNMSDSGTYHCIASNDLETKSRSVKLDIIDVDECQMKTRNILCEQKCLNTQGSYRCLCYEGYKLGNDLHTCHDINECEDSSSTCSHTCNNTNGSYICSCPFGYELYNNGHNCSDIDECSVFALNNCSQLCENTPGGYECSCTEGYALSNDNTSCLLEQSLTLIGYPLTKAVGIVVIVVTTGLMLIVSVTILLGGYFRNMPRYRSRKSLKATTCVRCLYSRG
ncbi:uncharacterized protein LOC124452992 isoform X3 [Xenia sp. Carnegie-2017]|uniref:uncharacterized protein LOC124452992 isoform X3 n=1 Tax=Xenia sp. Carnegie-2017 TaxID=2897299 RepID=UPI001F047EA0|nr:uncharacterized protein LOC124452992 isoform X3 [Xenia sp. Carnegie-2017]